MAVLITVAILKRRCARTAFERPATAVTKHQTPVSSAVTGWPVLWSLATPQGFAARFHDGKSCGFVFGG